MPERHEYPHLSKLTNHQFADQDRFLEKARIDELMNTRLPRRVRMETKRVLWPLSYRLARR